MRVSALPQLFSCASSQLPTDQPYDPPSDAAELGTAVHEALSLVALDKPPDSSAMAALAARHGVKPGDVEMLTRFGALAWQEVREHFHSPRVEEPLASQGLVGHADVFACDDMSMAILDWKTNRQRTNYRPQLRGYGTCAIESYGVPSTGYVTLVTVWLRLGEIDVMRMAERDAMEFREQFGAAKARIGKEYNPGDTCTYCRRQLVCEARRDYVRSAAGALEVVGAGAIPTRETLLSLYPRAQLLTRALDQYKHAVRMTLREHGAYQDAAGNTYELGESKRETIRAREAWPVLTAHGFSDDDLAACATMSTGAVKEIVTAKAPPRGKGKAKNELMDALRVAGATEMKITDIIKVTKGGRK